jgi:hypothetical protein
MDYDETSWKHGDYYQAKGHANRFWVCDRVKSYALLCTMSSETSGPVTLDYSLFASLVTHEKRDHY